VITARLADIVTALDGESDQTEIDTLNAENTLLLAEETALATETTANTTSIGVL